MATITAIYAALGALLLLILTASVIARRKASQVGIGDGGDRVLACRIRAHGNAAETLPLALLLLLLLELGGLPAAWLHALGATLLAGRALHAWGLSRSAGVSLGRFVGMLLTLLVIAAMAALLLWRALVG
jgi:uncharacterized protein